MHPDCEVALEEALGRPVRKGEDKKLEDAVNLQMRLFARKDPEGWAAMHPLDRLQEAAKAAVADLTRELKLKQDRVRLQIAAHDRIENALADAFARLPANSKPGAMLRSLSDILAFDAKGQGMRSADSWAKAVYHESMGRLLPLWDSVKGFAHLFEDNQGVRDLVKELWGEDSGNAAAKAGAEAWRTVMDELRDRANASGMNIGRLNDDEWHYPQSHSQYSVGKAGLEQWLADTMPELDRSKFINEDGTRMDDARLSEVLGRVFDSIITDGHNKRELGKAGSGITADRLSQHRVLFFKDSESYLRYQGKYGDHNLWATLTGHVNAISRDIGLNEVLGPDAEETFRFFNDRTRLDELRNNPTKAAKINKEAAKNESLYDFVAGKTAAVNPQVQARWQAWRNFQTAVKLPQVVFTALGDEAGMAATAFANHFPWSQTFAREMKYLNPASAVDRRAAMLNGLGLNGMIGGLNRFGSEDIQLNGGAGLSAKARTFTGKLASTVLRATGAEAMWDGRRQALGSMLMGSIGHLTREVPKFEDLNASDHGILASKGVTATDWEVWKLAKLEDWGLGAHGAVTPKAIRDIPDEKLRELGDPTALRRHASTNLLAHVLEEVGMGVMETGARERSRNFLGTQPGTAWGELARSALLFKSFSFSMMQKHWARAGAMDRASDTASYVARLVVIGTVMGAVANQLRNLANGKDPGNIAEPKFWGEALLRGGGLGFYGDFLSSELSSHDTSLIPALMGPLYTDTEQMWNLTGAAAFKASRGERTDEGAKLVRFLRGNVPLLNMWYLRAAMDHLLWNEMQDAVSPGYLDRMQAKAYAERGTTYYWDPHEKAPSQPPDFAKLLQPERGRDQVRAMAAAVPFLGGD